MNGDKNFLFVKLMTRPKIPRKIVNFTTPSGYEVQFLKPNGADLAFLSSFADEESPDMEKNLEQMTNVFQRLEVKVKIKDESDKNSQGEFYAYDMEMSREMPFADSTAIVNQITEESSGKKK